MELEIKLVLSPEQRAAVEADPAFSGSEPRRVQTRSTYYDTPDLALRRRFAVVRVRAVEGRFVQTVKGLGSEGLGARGEWEWEIGEDAVDREAIAREPATAALVGDLTQALGPVFTTEVERVTRLVTLPGGTVVEVAFDAGELRAGDRHEALSELELELKDGPAAPLYALAAELARRYGLRYGALSKGERGYALVSDAEPPRPEPVPVALHEDETLGAAVPRLIAASARDMSFELAAATRGEVEGIHRLRAAIRKLRALLVLFGPHLDPVATDRFNGELRDLGRVLGEGRDWDVFLGETLPEAAKTLGDEALAPLRRRAEGHREQAHAAVREILTGPVPTDLLLGLALWTSDDRWRRAPASEGEEASLGRAIPPLLDRLERRARRRGRHLRHLDDEGRHDLRKALKKLRFACEDVAILFRRKATERYVERIKRLLRDLGDINDAVVTVSRVQDLCEASTPEVSAAATDLLAWSDERRRHALRDLGRRWRKLRRTDPFWR